MNIFENRDFSFAKRSAPQIAIVLAIAILLWAAGAPMFLNVARARASSLSSVSDVLTTSNNGTWSGHTIQYTNASSTLAGQTIVITLDPDTNMFSEVGDAATSTHFGFWYFNGATTSLPIIANGTCPANDVSATSTSAHGTLVFTLCPGSTSIPAGATIDIQMATTTSDFANATSTGSYRVTIGGTQQNAGETRVAILPQTTLTAAINTTFTFTVSGVATSTVINGATTTAASTANTLPFGTLVAGTTTTLGQQLNVTTNARNGFSVTVQENQPPTSGVGAIINSFQNGATSSTPIPWVLPAGILNVYDTYSHIGLTSNDTLEGSGEFVSATTTKFVGNFYTAPRQVFSWTGPADGVTQNYGLASVAYSIAISPLQPAGNDYTNVITYVATPTF